MLSKQQGPKLFVLVRPDVASFFGGVSSCRGIDASLNLPWAAIDFTLVRVVWTRQRVSVVGDGCHVA